MESTETESEQPKHPFEQCEYYDAAGRPELLSWDTPEEALEEYIDGMLVAPDADAEAVIRQHGWFSVKGYVRRKVSDAEVARFATSAVELIDDRLSEEYGDPDGYDGVFGKTLADECSALLVPAIRAACDKVKLWACGAVAERAYSPDEVVAMMKIECPEWFEKAPA